MTDTDKLKRLAEAAGNPICSGFSWGKDGASYRSAIFALIAENERLAGCLREANKDTEHFERHWYLSCHERDEAVALLRECEAEMRSDVENRYDKDDVDSYPSIRGNYLQDIDTPNRVASFLSRLDAKDAP